MSDDILQIHSDILYQFDKQEEMLPELNAQIAQLERCSSASDTLAQLVKRRNSILNQTEKHFYLMQVAELIDAYQKELAKPIKISFTKKAKPPDDATNEIETAKNEIRKQYLQVAKKYIPIETESEATSPCTNCYEVFPSGNVCPNCGSEQEIATNYVSHSTKNAYDRRNHFRECINQYQGKQNSNISEKVYSDIARKLELHKLTPENTTKKHIMMFLKETGNSKHYDDINLIYHKLTGAPLEDISAIEDKLIQDFDALTEKYDEIYVKTKTTERKSFINTQYVFYQLLQKHNHKCDRSDFNFLKTIERQRFHDEVCYELFTQLGWSFTNLF